MLDRACRKQMCSLKSKCRLSGLFDDKRTKFNRWALVEDIWKIIGKGYELIKQQKFEEVFCIVTKAKKIYQEYDEFYAILALEVWGATFAKKRSLVLSVAQKLTTASRGSMPAWYKGVGNLNLGLLFLTEISSERTYYFSTAAKSYEIHIAREIPNISKEPYSTLNRTVTSLFKGICNLEENGSTNTLKEILKQFGFVGDSIIDHELHNISKAIKLQIQAQNKNFPRNIREKASNLVVKGVDPLYLCNLILRSG